MLWGIYNAVQEWMSYEPINFHQTNILIRINTVYLCRLSILLIISLFYRLFEPWVETWFIEALAWELDKNSPTVVWNQWNNKKDTTNYCTTSETNDSKIYSFTSPATTPPFLWCYVVDVVATRIDNEWMNAIRPICVLRLPMQPSSTMLYFSAMVFVRSWSSRGTALAKWGNMAYSQNCQNLHHLHPFYTGGLLGRPLDFQSLGSLKVLDLSCNELRDLETFKGLYALERLWPGSHGSWPAFFQVTCYKLLYTCFKICGFKHLKSCLQQALGLQSHRVSWRPFRKFIKWSVICCSQNKSIHAAPRQTPPALGDTPHGNMNSLTYFDDKLTNSSASSVYPATCVQCRLQRELQCTRQCIVPWKRSSKLAAKSMHFTL